ncbi:interleukin-17D [Ctenopharyngodon idella]|uniref:Interleukin 17D n=1 Tax=Ctenopharyngodon idella TaxID=7959 RepID=U3PEQ2_CTEID|nr:interleukin-17D [Ctenopharyngodon idella]AGW43284.1 interleukin 17D [Ctenopharyngodon idella]
MRGRVVSTVVLVLLWCCGSAPGERGLKVSRRAPRTRSCLDLPEEILEQMFGRLSVGVLSAFHHTLQLAPPERQNLTCQSASRLARDRPRTPVNFLSLSPWAYRISHDPARYPRYLPEAYCLCKGCLTGPNGEESDRFRSTPVYMPTVILRRTGLCVGGRHSYTESYVSIAVGCTCVPLLERDRKRQQSKPSVQKITSKNSVSSTFRKN